MTTKTLGTFLMLPLMAAAAPAVPPVGTLDLNLEATVLSPYAALDGGSDGKISGTPAYMSPERWRGDPATPAGDMFTFGLMFFEVMTGRRALAEGRRSQRRQRNARTGLQPRVADVGERRDRAGSSRPREQGRYQLF